MTIANDSDFKAALDHLPPAQQRLLAARFTQNVLAFSRDPRVKGAVDAALREGISDNELALQHQSAKAARVESYTQCGTEADWSCQAGHFVAEAALACVRPAGRGNPAWDAAMNARMARAAAAIAEGEGDSHREAEAQYRAVETFFNT
ncbi:MAG: hypothetical protein KGZ83_17915 [Sulfuricella sp.]|nr:hypothetical protein [Sulfuricella sp.]